MRLRTDDTEAIDYIIALIYERSRIRLTNGKQALIRARLGKRLRQLGLATLNDYCDLLRQPGQEEEITHAVDALTTNFTQFLRESDHFEFLVRTAIPATVGSSQKPFQIWSAACATGEEPYSMAFYLHEHFPIVSGWRWRVWATDISTRALQKAAEGIYAEERLRQLPSSWIERYFKCGQGEWAGYYKLKRLVTDQVQFQQLNLLGPYTLGSLFPVIFCRNVMIYFDRATQEELVRRLIQCLSPSGYLIIGHSESLTGMALPLRCLRPSIYQRV